MTDELKNYISTIDAPNEQASVLRQDREKLQWTSWRRTRDQHLLQTFLQDCEELQDKTEVRNSQVQEDTYNSSRTIHSK